MNELWRRIYELLELAMVRRTIAVGMEARRLAIELGKDHDHLDRRLLSLARREWDLMQRVGRAPREL